MEFFIVRPDGAEQEITNDVLHDANNITEFVFDLNDFVIPSDVNIILSNNEGRYAPEVEIFRDFDINQLFIRITNDIGQLLFIGILADVKYNTSAGTASFRISNVITQLLGQSVTGFSMIASPSEIIHALLRRANISENFLDNTRIQELNFMFNTLADLEADYPGGGVNAAERTVDWSLLNTINDPNGDKLFSFVSGRHVFKPRAEQKFRADFPDETPIIDILKEVVGQSGMMLYTERGVFTMRLYPFGETYYTAPQIIPSDSVISASIKYDRPLAWRRSEVVAPYFDGASVVQASLKASNIDFSDSGFLDKIFSAKPVKFDGLDNKVFHDNLDSVTNALNAILHLRGPARYHSVFDLSLATASGQALLPAIELFKPMQISFLDHCTNGLAIEMKKQDDKLGLKILSADELYEYRPAVNAQVLAFEALGDQSLYPDRVSDLTFGGITVNDSVVFLHRNNRANPALLDLGGFLVILNNTPNTVRADFTLSGGFSDSVTLEPDGFHEITTSDTVFAEITITFLTNCGDLSEEYRNVKALLLPPSDNLLLTNYCTALLTDNDGIISQVDV